jgi:hypothetical protein
MFLFCFLVLSFYVEPQSVLTIRWEICYINLNNSQILEADLVLR